MTTPLLPAPLAALAGWASSVTILLLAFLIVFGVAAVGGRWRHAFTALLAGPGLFGVLTRFHIRYPMTYPVGPPFPLIGGVGDLAAALGVSLATILAWRARCSAPRAAAWALLGALLGAAPAVTGADTVANSAIGAAFGFAWAWIAILGGLVLHALLEPDSVPPGVTIPFCGPVTSWADRRLWGNTRVLWGLIGLGALLRLPGIWTWAIGPDASRYAAMADALNHNGEFLMPWGDVYSPGTGLQYSHHFPPLYPALLAGFYKVFGFSVATTRLAAFVLAFAALAVTYLCTKDLYGKTKGLIAAALVSLSPVLIMTTNKAYAENLLLALFVLAMWAILKSLEKPRFIIVGAVFAGLGYLTKSSMGYFFIVAGLGGLAWRLYWKGWKVLRDPAYIGAIAIFAAMVAAWAWRNWELFASLSTSTHLDAAYANAFAHPTLWLRMTVYSFIVMFGLGYLVFMAVLPWLPQLRRIPRLASEHDSGLWLAITLPLLLTVVIDAALWMYERDFFIHNVRYVSFAIVPLSWLVMRHAPRSKATWVAIGMTFAILLVGSVYYTLPNRPLNTEVADALGPMVHDGDSLTFVGDNDVYRYYFAITHDGTQRNHTVLYEPQATGLERTDWVVVRGDGAGLDGHQYVRVWSRSQGHGLLAEAYTIWRQTLGS
ncbi:MAG: glycosyltransferase family 39 protein [bacterium]